MSRAAYCTLFLDANADKKWIKGSRPCRKESRTHLRTWRAAARLGRYLRDFTILDLFCPAQILIFDALYSLVPYGITHFPVQIHDTAKVLVHENYNLNRMIAAASGNDLYILVKQSAGAYNLHKMILVFHLAPSLVVLL